MRVLIFMRDNMQKYLVPREGLMVRDPGSYSPLPKDGMLVDWNGNAGRFWRRRVKQGDCSFGEPKKIETEITETETTSRKRSK